MTTEQWQLERALKALELAAACIAVLGCESCPVKKPCDSFHKGGCTTYITKYFLRKTRGMKK